MEPLELFFLFVLEKFVQNTQVWTLFTLNTYFERAMCISNINMMQKLVQWSSYFDVAEALHINIRVQWSNNIMYECNEAKDIRVQWSKRYTSAMKQKNIILYTSAMKQQQCCRGFVHSFKRWYICLQEVDRKVHAQTGEVGLPLTWSHIAIEVITPITATLAVVATFAIVTVFT